MTITWKPDGSAIAFEAYEGEYNMQIWISSIATGNHEKITNYANQFFQPEWSKSEPAFFAMSRAYIFRTDENGENIQQVNLGGINGYSPALTWNGNRLAFTSELNGNNDIWIANIDGSGLTQITTHTSWDNRSRWSPDGTKLLFESDRSGERNIWIYDFNSETFAQVTTQGARCPTGRPTAAALFTYTREICIQLQSRRSIR